MLAVTGGASTVGSLALAWAEKSHLALPFAVGRLSFVLGLASGIIIVLLVDVQFTAKWILLPWADRR